MLRGPKKFCTHLSSLVGNCEQVVCCSGFLPAILGGFSFVFKAGIGLFEFMIASSAIAIYSFN